MTWIIALSALALFVFLIISLLIVSSEADDLKEALVTNHLAGKSDNDVSPSSLPAMPERMAWKLVEIQRAPLRGLLVRVL